MWLVSRLNIFIDESGDFGFGDGHADYFVLTLVLHEQSNDISNQVKILDDKMESYNHIGMFHIRELLKGNGIYKNFDISERKKILWTMIFFYRSIEAHSRTIIIDRAYINNSSQLNRTLITELKEFTDDNSEYLSSFNDIRIYYDNGQSHVSVCLDAAFINYEYTLVRDFDKTKKKLFQVADLLTFTDKSIYKFHMKKMFNHAEKSFLTRKNYNISKSVSSIFDIVKKKRK